MGPMEVKKVAYDELAGAFQVFRQDLEALPEDAVAKSFGPKTRTVADIVYEINFVNDRIATVMRGETPPPFPGEGWNRAPEGYRTKDMLLKTLKESSSSILSMVEDYSDADMEESLATGSGQRTRLERCQFMTVHLWYHCGQLNYIQTLLGDEEIHWR